MPSAPTATVTDWAMVSGTSSHSPSSMTFRRMDTVSGVVPIISSMAQVREVSVRRFSSSRVPTEETETLLLESVCPEEEVDQVSMFTKSSAISVSMA